MQQNYQTEFCEPLKVHYFYIRGQCQPIRHLLYYLQVPFQDIMHERSQDNEVEVGFNLGLPMLQDGDLHIHEAVAIMSYICRKYSGLPLIGLTLQTTARIQEVLMKYSMQRKKITAHIFQSFATLSGKTDKELHVQQCLKRLIGECKFVQYCLRGVNKSRKFVLDNLSIIDFVFYETCFYICGFFQEYIVKHVYFKLFVEFKNRFQELEFHQKNRDKIDQKYLFFQFRNPEMNEQIQNLWKGDKKCLIKRANNTLQ